jgi:hypothetical protein
VAGGGERRARLVLAAVVIAMVGGAAALDLPRVSGGEFWGDGATYYAMAWSLAWDLDLRYEARDLERVRQEYPRGPQGLFLKRASGGVAVDGSVGFPWLRRVRADEGRLYYAKAFAYPLLAAPLVRLFGTRGLMVTNALVLGLSLWLGYGVLRRRGSAPQAALVAVLALLLTTVAPLYLAWPTPEIFGLGLITSALAAWAAGRPLLAAALFGVAGYLKPPNVLMAVPLGLDPLLPRAGERLLSERLLRRVAEATGRALVIAGTAACFYGLNAVATGERNYQGGERKTFYGRFPFDASGATFDGSGFWMTTNRLGPLVEGSDEGQISARTGPARDPREIPESFAWNLAYFWVGRFGGALPYFFPAVAALALFLLAGSRDRSAWLALVAVVLSWLAYIWIIPDNWYGGGGTVGNRYFLSLLPAFFFLLPTRRERPVAALGVVGAAIFLAPILASPVVSSLRPGDHATRGVFRLLPAELTMLNDLSVFTEPWRKKRPFGFVGDSTRHADVDAYFLYFMDDGTFGKEAYAGRDGFWLRGGERAEGVVRAFDLAPVSRVVLRLIGGPVGDSVTARLGGSSRRIGLGPGQVQEISVPAGRGLRYYDTYLHVLHLRSRRGAPLADGRSVGAFVEVRLEMGPPFGPSTGGR